LFVQLALFFGGRSEADMRRRAEVVEHLTPSRVICCTATMTLVDHHQVEEVCRELPEDLLPFFAPGHSLVQRQVDLVILLDLSVCDLERANLARETKYSLFPPAVGWEHLRLAYSW